MEILLKVKWKLAIILGVILSLYACNYGTADVIQQLGKVEAPIPELAKAYTSFKINSSEKNELELPSGTKIIVEANSLVDAEGKLITGEAIIQYREYHDAVDVLLSGIPMNYEVQGRKRTMQTAGMFDINGVQGGQPIFVKDGVGVQVDFASFEEGADYNLFNLNEEKGWQFVDYVNPTVNEDRLKTEEAIKLLTKKLKAPKENFFVFNYNAILDVEYNNDWYKIKENKDNPSLAKKVKRYDLDYFMSSIYQLITYKGNSYPADMMVWKHKIGKRWPAWVRQKECVISIEPKRGKLYRMKASLPGENKEFTVNIEVVVPLKYLFKYSPKDWKNNFQKVMKDVSAKEEQLRIELEEVRKRLEQQAAVIRSFEIAGFGIYNYDKLMKEENRVDVVAVFKMEGMDDLDLVICLPEDNKTVIKYPKSDWDKVVLLPGNSARFVAILPNKSVGIYTEKEYQAIDFEQFKGKIKKPSIEFTLVKVIDKVNSEDAIRKALNDDKV